MTCQQPSTGLWAACSRTPLCKDKGLDYLPETTNEPVGFVDGVLAWVGIPHWASLCLGISPNPLSWFICSFCLVTLVLSLMLFFFLLVFKICIQIVHHSIYQFCLWFPFPKCSYKKTKQTKKCNIMTHLNFQCGNKIYMQTFSSVSTDSMKSKTGLIMSFLQLFLFRFSQNSELKRKID